MTANKEQVFSDVIDDFSEIFSVVMHFREWKYNFPTSYKQAYLPLCLPKLLKPYITLQLVSWNPLADDVCLELMPWIQDLLFFVYQGESFDVDPSDPDLHLIPRIVETVIIPKLTGKNYTLKSQISLHLFLDFVSEVWDPLSSTQTSYLVNFIQQLLKKFPTITLKHLSYQSMLKAVIQKNQITMEKDMISPTFSAE